MSDSSGREYQAMEPKDRNPKRKLALRLKNGERYSLYFVEIHLVRTAPDQSCMVLFHHTVNAVLWGRNLGQIHSAIDGENIGWVQEYDAAGSTGGPPTDPAAPVIERMEVFMKKEKDEAVDVDGARVDDEGPRTSRH